MKFKSVDIVGFRAYAREGDGAFDFSKSDGDVSNFIAIYAPNGFGKSSFYDAMEWAITNNIGRYVRESQRTNNDAASLHLNTSDSPQRILKNRYIPDNAPSYVKVRTNGEKEFTRTVRRPAAGHRDYTYDPSRTDKQTKHLAEIFLSQDAIDSFLKEDRPEQRYERFMGSFGGDDEKYRASLFSAIKSCGRELKQLSDTLLTLEENLREPALEFSVEEVNKTIDEINSKGDSFPRIGSAFSELEQTELLSMLSKRIVQLTAELSYLDQNCQTIELCLVNLPRLEKYRDQRIRLDAEIVKMQLNRNDIASLSKMQDTRESLEQRLRVVVNEIELVSIVLSNQQQLNKVIEDIENYKEEVSGLDKKSADLSILISENSQTANYLRHERVNSDTQLAILFDDLSKVDSQFLELDAQDKLIVALSSKIAESERRLNTARALNKTLLEELSRYSNLSFENYYISEDAQVLLKPSAEFLITYEQQVYLRGALQDRIISLEESEKDLTGQSADFFALISMTKTLLSKSKSDQCPVCNAQYESHAALLERIQSNGRIETALHSLLANKVEIQERILQIDSFLNQGHGYLTSLKSSAILDITTRLKDVDAEVERLNREVTNLTYEQSVKIESRHRLSAEVRNLAKAEYIDFLKSSISDVEAYLTKIDSKLSEVLESSNNANEALGEIAGSRAKAAALLAYAEEEGLYKLYKGLKAHYILLGEDITETFTSKYNELVDAQNGLNKELLSVNAEIDKFRNSLTQPEAYSAEDTLIEKLASLTDQLRELENAIIQIEATLAPLVSNVKAQVSLLSSELQVKKTDAEAKNATVSSLLMLANIVKTQINDVLPFFKYRELRSKSDALRDKKNLLESLAISLGRELRNVEIKLKERIDNFFYTELITSIYRKIDPHPFFKTVRFECIFPVEEKPRLEVYLYEEDLSQPISPALYFSSAQLNILSLSIFLAKALHVEDDGNPVKAILIDDPIHSMDSINVLSVIDLLRNISVNFDRQIILSTHDENFYELLKLKVPEQQCGSKFIRFKSFGVVHADGDSD